jgi:acetyltransferase
MWNLIAGEHLGMAKFASIGNKLDLDEVDFLEYFGEDPDTKCIFMYLESINRGDKLIEVASNIDKPVIVLKSNTTPAGQQAAMSHTAALSNDDEIIDAAFEKAGIIRIHRYRDFISTAKAWKLPPMKGDRLMMVTPAGGFSVICADLIEKSGFEFADPGKEFYESLQQFSTSGVINFSNPLDVGDIYDEKLSGHVFFSVLHNENVDGLVYVSQRPNMPLGEDIFSRMFRTDLSKETWGAILSSGKPVWLCLFGPSESMAAVKMSANFPIFDSPEEMIQAIRQQRDYYLKKEVGPVIALRPEDVDMSSAEGWVRARSGVLGEEALDLLSSYGLPVAQSAVVAGEDDAATIAGEIGFPVVMKVVSPDAIHKTEAKGVMVDIRDEASARSGFQRIRENLESYKPGADFQGVRIQHMAQDGYDMFVGGTYDECFGPVVCFGFGGVYVEIFKDVGMALCPASPHEIEAKVKKLKAYDLIKGVRGQSAGDIEGYIDAIVRISHLMKDFPEVKELDINPLRLLADGSGVTALDARVRIGL